MPTPCGQPLVHAGLVCAYPGLPIKVGLVVILARNFALNHMATAKISITRQCYGCSLYSEVVLSIPTIRFPLKRVRVVVTRPAANFVLPISINYRDLQFLRVIGLCFVYQRTENTHSFSAAIGNLS
ncbi:MAG: hypothetical protein K0Q60_4558 [Microvirga sp.]|nr:hypothetical protein [Microvirga sp.]